MTLAVDFSPLPPELVALARDVRDAAWQDNAACKPENAVELDPITGPGALAKERPLRRVAANRYCSRCPVVRECGTYADALLVPGVAGGSLRYIDPSLGYVTEELIKDAAPSRFDIRRVRARRIAQRYGEE